MKKPFFFINSRFFLQHFADILFETVLCYCEAFKNVGDKWLLLDVKEKKVFRHANNSKFQRTEIKKIYKKKCWVIVL